MTFRRTDAAAPTAANTWYERSRTYRKEFFRHHFTDCLGLYFCTYCGKLLPKKRICVDHVIPVHAAETDKRVRKKLKRNGYDGVNDRRNLVASCRRCNSRKGAKQGVWLV